MLKDTIILWILCCGFGVFGQTPEDDEVTANIAGYQHQFYSGFLDIGVIQEQESVHYVFFQSQNDSSKNHLIIWLSGGPGCSSLFSLFTQTGPFIFQPESMNLSLNKHSWNQNANLLYLQLPMGVGFSSMNQQPTQNDEMTAKAAQTAIRLFFNRFPSYKKNQLYLSGSGYAANYISYLAKLITIQNNDPFSIYDDKINLKGLLLGNPCTKQNQCFRLDSKIQSANHYQFLYKRAFQTKQIYDQFTGSCLLDYYSYDCSLKRAILDKNFQSTNSSAYNIYSKCYKQQTSGNFTNEACEDSSGVLKYLNDQQVRKIWNIQSKVEWKTCNWDVVTNYQQGNGSYWIYPFLLQNTTLKVWIYSGDMDSVVPTLGTKKWISTLRKELDIPIQKVWRKWWVPSYKDQKQDQVGGFIWQLERITLVTIRAAGHRTAFDQPESMQKVLNSFLNNDAL